jgi:hypothetical protein
LEHEKELELYNMNSFHKKHPEFCDSWFLDRHTVYLVQEQCKNEKKITLAVCGTERGA